MKNKAIGGIAFDNGILTPPRGQLSIYAMGLNSQIFYKSWDSMEWHPSQTDWFLLDAGFIGCPQVSDQEGGYTPDDITVAVLYINRTAVIDDFVYPFVLGGLQSTTPQNIQNFLNSGGGVQFAGPLNVTQAGVAATVSGGPAVLAFVGRGIDNQAYLKVYSEGAGDWTDWFPLVGLQLLSEPVVISQGSLIRIFAVGLDRQMYVAGANATNTLAYAPQSVYPPIPQPYPQPPLPGLIPWQPAGECFFSDPAVVMWDATRIDVFGVSSNNDLLHRAMVNGNWIIDWETLGGAFDSPPAAVAWAPNRLDIFGLGTDDKMYHKWWAGNAWGPSQTEWEPLGAPPDVTFNSTPFALSAGPDDLHVFAIATDGGMYHKAWNGGPDWIPSKLTWDSLGGQLSIPSTLPFLPPRLDFDQEIVFNDGTPVGGNMHVTLFNDGSSNFSGHLHDSGFWSYACSIGFVIVDSQDRAYTFEADGHVWGTDLPGSRDLNWNNSGAQSAVLQDNWGDLFGCGGTRVDWEVVAETDPPGGLVHLAPLVLQNLGGASAFTVIPLVTF
jgi:hypothetical protein